MVEFALVLPVLLLLLLGIIDFGFYFYNDLQLTQAARDAARYASVNDSAGAQGAIADARSRLVSSNITTETIDYGTQGNQARVALQATYTFVTPLPGIAGMGPTRTINATAIMRRE